MRRSATIQIGEESMFKYGQWGTQEVTETKFSNWQELNNLAETLERVVASHKLQGLEILIFTHNTTAAYWKGT